MRRSTSTSLCPVLSFDSSFNFRPQLPSRARLWTPEELLASFFYACYPPPPYLNLSHPPGFSDPRSVHQFAVLTVGSDLSPWISLPSITAPHQSRQELHFFGRTLRCLCSAPEPEPPSACSPSAVHRLSCCGRRQLLPVCPARPSRPSHTTCSSPTSHRPTV